MGCSLKIWCLHAYAIVYCTCLNRMYENGRGYKRTNKVVASIRFGPVDDEANLMFAGIAIQAHNESVMIRQTC